MNGTITYSSDETANYYLGTNAIYSCDEGFFLEVMEGASMVRICEDDDGMNEIGEWNNKPPRCVRKSSN